MPVTRLPVFICCTVLLLTTVLPAAAAPADRSPPFARALYYYTGLQGRVLWVDATANLDRITSPEGVADIVSHAKQAGFTTIVVDVKPVSGHVLFQSKIAPRLTSWRGKTYPDADVLQLFLEQGRKLGLEIAAAVNVFSEGHKHFQVGLAYERPDWQSVVLSTRRELRAEDAAGIRIRAAEDPEEPDVPVVHGPDLVVPEGEWDRELIVVLQHDGTVDGMIDRGVLGDEPLTAPEEGRLLIVRNAHRDWAVTHLQAGTRARFVAESRLLPIAEAPSEPVSAFANPLHPAVRNHELSLIRELVERYPVDAVVLDRMRYSSIWSDFSPISRAAFERWLGRPVSRWPEDVLDVSPVPGDPVICGPLFRQWLQFRATVISEFLRDVRRTVRRVRAEVQVAAYVGSWFHTYYGMGVNWASERYPVQTPWATPSYSDAGYAEQLDWLTTGCYYPIPTRDQARQRGVNEGATVETAAVISNRVVANAVPVYAGLYVANYEGRPEDFAASLDTAVRRSAGVMVFDCSHVYQHDWWPIIAGVFQRPASTPHSVPGLLSQVRWAQDAVVATGEVDSFAASLPVVPFQPGGG